MTIYENEGQTLHDIVWSMLTLAGLGESRSANYKLLSLPAADLVGYWTQARLS
jgi:hypothetical protein